MNPTIDELCVRYPDLAECLPQIEGAGALMARSFRQGGKLLVCGNGGSAADSEHIVGELMKGFNCARPIPEPLANWLAERFGAEGEYLAGQLQGALPAISLASQTGLMTACGNDLGGDMAFAQQVYGYGRPGDVLLAISTSGNATNAAHALRVAAAVGLRTIALTGRSGGALAPLAEVAIRVPWDRTPDVQERHLAVYHALCAQLESEFFGS